MRGRSSSRPATSTGPARDLATHLFRGLARGVALVWLAPALLFNVDWTGHGSWQANTAAVFMILGSALFIEGALRLRSWVLSPICIVAALFLVYVNTKQATRVLSLSSEAASEAKAAEIAGGSHLASQRSQLRKQREAQMQLAGETAVGVLEAKLKELQLSDLRAWNATSRCKDVTVRTSAAFCAKVAEAEAKVEAAKKRDTIDADLAKLPVPRLTTATSAEAPVADPYVANVVALVEEIGFRPSERLVKAEEAMARALGFELLAALGPTCWLAFVNMLVVGGAYTSASRVRKAVDKPITGDGVGQVTAPPEKADDLDRCIADVFEDAPAGVMKAREIRPLVQAWFDARILKLDEGRLWAKLGQRFKRDPNNGRPRYLGLKPRVRVAPRLAIDNVPARRALGTMVSAPAVTRT